MFSFIRANRPAALLVLCLVALGISFSTQAQAQEDSSTVLVPGPATDDSLLDMSLEDLMKVKITTAGKSEQTVVSATSVASVITRKEIEGWGVQTLYDALKRMPGFFPSHQATWSLLTSRGLPSDGNDHFLLLVDGHPQNSIVGQGFQQQDMIPLLDQVEQIEIIRGPGSVLWGSSAVMGIVNIITRDHVDRPRLTVSGQHGPGAQYLNYLEGLGNGEDVKGFYSVSVWGAQGHEYDEKGNSAVSFPWGSQATDPWFGPWPWINKQREGFELYGKLNFKSKTEIVGRLLRTSFNYVWDEWSGTEDAAHELGNRRAYIGIRRFFTPAEKVKLEMSLFGDFNLQARIPLEINDDSYATRVQDQTNEEFALGAEVMATVQVNEANTLKIGAKLVRTEIGPNRDARLDPTTNTPIDEGTDTDTNGVPFNFSVPFYGVEPGIDHAAGLYVEDTHDFGDTTLFAGGRLDANDFREKGVIFLPRFGAIHEFRPEIVGKYTFNTGYLRPSAVYSKTVGYIVDTSRGGAFPISRVSDSESVQSHDVQLSYSTSKTFGAITFFYMNVNDFISFDANNSPQGYKNIGDASTIGVEIEGQHELTRNLRIYENFSWAEGDIENSAHEGALSDGSGRTLNYPRYILNLGATYKFVDEHSFNLHALAWHDMRYRKPKDQIAPNEANAVFDDLGPEVYVDANYRIQNFIWQDMTFNAFVWNVMDNQNRIGMVVNNGTYRPPGRAIGAKVSYQF